MRTFGRWALLVALFSILAVSVFAADVIRNTGSMEYQTTGGLEVVVESNEVEVVKANPPVAGVAGSLILPGAPFDCTFTIDVGSASQFVSQVASPPVYGCAVLPASVSFEGGTGRVTSLDPFTVELDSLPSPGPVTIRYQVGF